MIDRYKNYRYRFVFTTTHGTYYTKYTNNKSKDMIRAHQNILKAIQDSKNISINIKNDDVKSNDIECYITFSNKVLLDSIITLEYEKTVEDTDMIYYFY